MFQPHLRPEAGASAETLPPSSPTRDDSLRAELREPVQRLRVILPAISVSVLALRHQNAELDHDIASVLSEHVCAPLDEEIEHLQSLLASHAWRKHQQEVRV